jgi:hypothetical protein
MKQYLITAAQQRDILEYLKSFNLVLSKDYRLMPYPSLGEEVKWKLSTNNENAIKVIAFFGVDSL